MALIRLVAPQARITATGAALPFPMALSDAPVRAYLGDYGSVPLEDGIRATYEAFEQLLAGGLLTPEQAV